MTRVFVYGTLRRGAHTRHAVLCESRFAGSVETAPGFVLRDLGHFPAMHRGGDETVVGEVYEVDDDTLRRLDAIEGHPRFYCRELVQLGDGTAAEAYMQSEAQLARAPRIDTGDWLDNSNKKGGTAWQR